MLRGNADYRAVDTHSPTNSDREYKQIIFRAIYSTRFISSFTIARLMETIFIHTLYLIIIVIIIESQSLSVLLKRAVKNI